jgi:GNAT superfamily N-acetyltransferase
VEISIRRARREDEERCWALEAEVWPTFHAEAVEEDYYAPELHVVAESADGEIVATGNAVPWSWQGSVDALEGIGWQEVQREWALRARRGWRREMRRRTDNVACALGISISPRLRFQGLGLRMLDALRERAAAEGYEALLAPVRPTAKWRMPELTYRAYMDVRLPDGQHFDPWLRLHERAGGRILTVCEESFRMRFPRSSWERMTGLRLPENGCLLLEGGNDYLRLANAGGEMVEGSIWVLHALRSDGVGGGKSEARGSARGS